jgi:alpha-1,3/alpha-1,6-mannosyltransferase
LVVNLCIAAKKHGYEPSIYTPYHHKSFPETHDGTIKIFEHGSFFGIIPDCIFGKLKGIFAYIRCIICTIWLILFNQANYSAVVADQVSVVLPLLRLFGYKTIFYCHYPDKLLAGKRQNILKKIYRFVIDLVEEISLLFAQKIYVNS